MKGLIFTICFFVLIPAGCAGHMSGGSSAFGFVKWNGDIYIRTNEKVDHVGEKLGEVGHYSDKESRRNFTELPEGFSNMFKVGTKLYEISDVNISHAIAVQIKDGEYQKLIIRKAWEKKH